MLLVFGSINLDIAFRADHLPQAGETVLGECYLVSPGGKGANQAHAARRMGVEVGLVGSVGRDAFAAPALARLEAAGVDLSALQRVEAPTGCAGIVVDARGENQIVVAPGANLALRDEHLPDALLARARAVLLQQEVDAAANAAVLARAQARGCLTVLNNAPARELGLEVLRHVDVLVVNAIELAATLRGVGLPGLTADDASREGLGGPAPDEARAAGNRPDDTAARRVQALSQALGLTVVLTRGADGVLACAGGDLIEVPAFAVDVVDTTGAGDTFAGVLTVGLMAGDPLESALRTAAAAAALACTRAGAQVAQPSADEVRALLART
jgi:ribokinase